MFEGIDLSNVTGWTVAGALCILFVLAFFKGWIVPASQARVWVEAWQTDRHTVEKLASQIEDLATGQESVTSFICSIKAVSGRVGDDRSPCRGQRGRPPTLHARRCGRLSRASSA